MEGTKDSSMPFISGVLHAPKRLDLSEPEGDLAALIPLSKVQQLLWLDYISRPQSTHYHLTLRINLRSHKVQIEDLLRGK